MMLAVDIDGVLCTEERQFSRPLADPIKGAKAAIDRLRAGGHTVVLYSSRTWAEVEVTRHWLKAHGFEFDGLQLGKMTVDRFLDDRGIQFTSWDEALTQLESPKDVPGGWRAEHNLKILRRETKRLLEDIAARPGLVGPVLEVGPMWQGSAVFQRMPETYVDAKSLFESRGMAYFSLDIDPITGAEYIGDFLQTEQSLRGDTFGAIVLMSAIEHIPQIWQVPEAIYRALKPGGLAFIMTPWAVRLHGPHPDSWRLSDEAYRALFADTTKFEMITLEKVGCSQDSLDPVGFYCVLRRK